MLEINERFTDKGELLHEFADEFLVVCPKCAAMAKVFPVEIGSEKISKKLLAPRRVVCLNCAYFADWRGNTIWSGSNVDWYFRLPVWLQISCCGENLWAYNLKHLEILENYVAAKLRERTKAPRKSFLSKLPSWIKSAKNRREILKAIGKLKEKAETRV